MRRRVVLAATTAAWLAAGPASAQAIRIPEDCREVLPTNVTVHLKPEGRTDAAVRSALRTAASVDAVQQTTGTRVRSQAEIDLESEHKTGVATQAKSRFTQRMVSQASGLVALTVLEEVVGSDQASLHASAAVCIPKDPAAVKETVVIVGFLSSRGEALQDGLSALNDIFSASRSFSVTDDQESVDWTIDGRIDDVDVRDIAGVQRTTQLLLRPGETGTTGFRRLQVAGHLDARNSDGRHVTLKFEQTHNVAAARDPLDALKLWVPQLLSDASRDLEARLVSERAGAPAPERSPEPKW
jgi:hypothetical protein